MDYEKWIKSEFLIIENRVIKSISDEVAKYITITTDHVGIDLILKDHVAFGLKTYRNEVIRLIDDLHKFEFLRPKDLRKIRALLIQNTNNTFCYIKAQCNADNVDNNTFKHILDNINCIIELSIEKLIILRRRKVYHLLWELLRIIISALVGALIALAFKQ